MWRIFIGMFLAASLLSFARADAATITAAQLPAAYRECRPFCNVSLTSSVDIGAMSAFQARVRQSDGQFQTNWLLRYSLTPTAGATGPRYMWLSANASYDLSQSEHELTLLLDHADVLSHSQWQGDADPLDWDFTVTTEALLSGSAEFLNTCCTDPAPPSGLTPWSDPIPPAVDPQLGGPIVCAADGCSARGQLNFIYFQFREDESNPGVATLLFDANRDGTVLYSQSTQYTGDNPFFLEQRFELPPVPLPAALTLLFSGLGPLAWLATRRRLYVES